VSLEDRYPASESVHKLEHEVGWNAEKSDFIDSSILRPLAESGVGKFANKECVVDKKELLRNLLSGTNLYDIMDVVIPTIRDLDFLEKWKPFIEPFHIILIQDGDPSKKLHIPSWANYELYNRNDIERALGEDSWAISQKGKEVLYIYVECYYV
jgi:hypothetical protein